MTATRPPRAVDVHAHFYPRAYLDAVLRIAEADASPAGRDLRRVLAWVSGDERMWSPERRIADIGSLSLDVQILSLSIPNVYVRDRGAAVELTRLANDGLIALARRCPDRLFVFASVPIEFANDAVHELDRLAAESAVVGVVLGANVDGQPLDAPPFLPLYAELERRDLPILIHPMRPPGIEAMADHMLAPLAGYLFDSTLAALRLVFAGVFERHPRLQLIMPHLGAVLPYMMGRVRHGYEIYPACRAHISAPPETYLKRFYYDTVCGDSAALRFAATRFGADHLLFGTDYPFWTEPEGVRQDIEHAGLSAGEVDAVMAGNATGLLRLPAAKAEVPQEGIHRGGGGMG